VATAVGGLVDAIEDGVTGRLVEPGDSGALRAAIEGLLADEALRLRLGAAARDAARSRFSWDAATRETIRAYTDALR